MTNIKPCPFCGRFQGFFADVESMKLSRCDFADCGQAILWEE